MGFRFCVMRLPLSPSAHTRFSNFVSVAICFASISFGCSVAIFVACPRAVVRHGELLNDLRGDGVASPGLVRPCRSVVDDARLALVR